MPGKCLCVECVREKVCRELAALKAAESAPSASTNSDYEAALRVIDEFVGKPTEIKTKISINDLFDFCIQSLNADKPNPNQAI